MAGQKPIVVRDAAARRVLEAQLLNPERAIPIVVVAARDGKPLVELDALGSVVQSELACYYIPGTHVLRKLNGVLGKNLAVWPESLRIFWPKLKVDSDARDHPCLPVLHNEPEAEVLHDFRLAFDLSRPLGLQIPSPDGT